MSKNRLINRGCEHGESGHLRRRRDPARSHAGERTRGTRRSQHAKYGRQLLANKIRAAHRNPRQSHHDQGRQMHSDLMMTLAGFFHTPPYVPGGGWTNCLNGAGGCLRIISRRVASSSAYSSGVSNSVFNIVFHVSGNLVLL